MFYRTLFGAEAGGEQQHIYIQLLLRVFHIQEQTQQKFKVTSMATYQGMN